MALAQRVKGFDLRPALGWSPAPALYMAVLALRQQVMSILQTLQADTWYSFEPLCRLVRELSRDLFSLGAPDAWRWAEDGMFLQPAKMPFDVWMATYGRVLAALFWGPASWLGFVELERRGEEPAGDQAVVGRPTRKFAVRPARCAPL